MCCRPTRHSFTRLFSATTTAEWLTNGGEGYPIHSNAWRMMQSLSLKHDSNQNHQTNIRISQGEGPGYTIENSNMACYSMYNMNIHTWMSTWISSHIFPVTIYSDLQALRFMGAQIMYRDFINRVCSVCRRSRVCLFGVTLRKTMRAPESTPHLVKWKMMHSILPPTLPD